MSSLLDELIKKRATSLPHWIFENPEYVLLSREETAALLGVQTNTLAVWALHQRYALPYVKVGRRVKYRLSDVLCFIEKNVQPGRCL
jgi:hypothetical protein